MDSKTGAEYRNQTKIRVQKFRQEQERRGYKSISVFISEDFRAELDRLNHEQRFNRQDAMDHIFNIYKKSVTSNATRTKSDKAKKPMDKGHSKDDKKNSENKPDFLDTIKEKLLSGDPGEISIEDRDRIIFHLYEEFPEKTQAQERIDLLNGADILFNGKPWTKKQFSDQLNLARRRKKARQK
ncbi:hypothetical protein [Desulfobacula sp.]|uniref:hypothetical protein n=1 Tax=Desulfobacula sp. TaxID=2593537 RepID=UPI002623B82B|nr:hypothetical protein [Desulfobacula sp.]